VVSSKNQIISQVQLPAPAQENTAKKFAFEALKSSPNPRFKLIMA
jgi:hypothetical protein